MVLLALFPTLLSLALHLMMPASTESSSVAPPDNAQVVARIVGDGVQVYACEAVDNKIDWAFKAPEASLFDETGRQIGKHYSGPSWESFDGSLVTGEVIAKMPAPDPSAIPWLLLRAKSHSGSGQFAHVTYVQRAQTKGGTAPTSGCDSAHLGAEARMRYSATYTFYRAATARE
jgi:hypothetical protein